MSRNLRGILTFGVGCIALAAAPALMGQSVQSGQTAQTEQTAQSQQEFEVASIKPSDMGKMAAAGRSGQMPRMGAHVDPARAEYLSMSLKQLIANAYDVKFYQVTGPDWLDSERFDIEAKIPEGISEQNAPLMLQALLKDRFKLTAHRETKNRPVLGLLIAKNGPKMQEAKDIPAPLDPNAPLKPGETDIDTPIGPGRMNMNQNGEPTLNLGTKGVIALKGNLGTGAIQLDAHGVTMGGLAEMLSLFAQLIGGGNQVVDMTSLKGNYDFTIDLPIQELMSTMGRMGAMGGGAAQQTPGAADTGGNFSITDLVQGLGLNLEPRNAPVEDVVVDHMEKAPTEN